MILVWELIKFLRLVVSVLDVPDIYYAINVPESQFQKYLYVVSFIIFAHVALQK